MNKYLPADEYYDTFDRSSSHCSAAIVRVLSSFYSCSTAGWGYFPELEAPLKRCVYDDMPGYGCLAQYLKNVKRDGAYRFQQGINLLVPETVGTVPDGLLRRPTPSLSGCRSHTPPLAAATRSTTTTGLRSPTPTAGWKTPTTPRPGRSWLLRTR